MLLGIQGKPADSRSINGITVVQQTVDLARIVQREEVRVSKAGRDLDFAQEPLGAERLGQLRAQDFDRDLAIMLQLVGKDNVGHPTMAQFSVDLVLVGQHSPQAVLQIDHTVFLEAEAVPSYRGEPGGASALTDRRSLAILHR
jgi:hypothetical protein